jgi:hypothetical protein
MNRLYRQGNIDDRQRKTSAGRSRASRLLLTRRAGWCRGLQALEEIGGALSVRSSLKDGVLVFCKDFEPVADVVGMIFPDLRGEAEVDAKEGGAKLCDQLLAGIARVAETLTAEVTIETCCMACPVREFVKDGGIVAFLVLESLKGRRLDVIGCGGVVSLIAAEADGCAGGADKLVSLGETIGKR